MPVISELILNTIIEGLPTGLLAVDPRGEIVVVNKALTRILGYSREDFVSKGLAGLLLSVEENAEFNQVIVEAIQRKRPSLHRVAPYLHPNGSRRQLSVSSSLLHKEEDVMGLVVIIEDITRLKKAHDREQSYLRELAHQHENRVNSLTKMAMSVAHQIRNPLVSIGGYAGLIRREVPDNTTVQERVGVVLSETAKLERITGAVSSYAAIGTPKPEKIELDAMSCQVCESMDALAGQRNITIDWDVQNMELNARVDPGLFMRALTCILTNCVDFADSDQLQIRLRASAAGGNLTLSIIDDGMGITEEDMAYIFDPFFSTKPDGLGMGLTVAEQIVQGHRGRITVRSNGDSGCKVIIQIPGAESQPEPRHMVRG